MNYRHIYHAGNFADVVKHCVLIALVDALKRKSKPFCVLDTHAGIGLYALQSSETQKKQEYQQGIAKLLADNSDAAPAVVKEYLATVQSYNNLDYLDFYPGSPLITIHALRPEDRLIASELHEEDVATLKQYVKDYDNVAVHHMDGYHAMKAFLPPAEMRGLVLIDPPFEKLSEFDDIITHLTLALKHFRGGTYAIWYPIKDRKKVADFYHDLKQLNFPLHYLEFSLQHPATETGLNAFGLAIINIPWQVDTLLSTEILPYLATVLECHWSMHSENNS